MKMLKLISRIGFKFMIMILAILISMTGILSAACETSAECWELTLKESIGISPWFIISMAAVMICLTGAAILYMIAHSFSLEKYKKIAMSEIMQGFASLILVALLFGMELSEQSLIPMIEAQAGAIAGSALGLGGKGEIVVASPIDLSLAFSRNLVACLENMYKNVYSDSKSTEMYMNLGTRIEVVGKALPVDWSLFNPRLIKKVQEQRCLSIANQKEVILGVNRYINVTEKFINEVKNNNMKIRSDFEPINIFRGAHEIEMQNRNKLK